jgi:hypothetical protein
MQAEAEQIVELVVARGDLIKQLLQQQRDHPG